MSTLRITGGSLRGRIIRAPRGNQTRPTQSRIRESIFNQLQNDLKGFRVLDLYAGSGVLGFEAISRGAAVVQFVESSKRAMDQIRANARELGPFDVEIDFGHMSTERFYKMFEKSEAPPFDVVLADPPYRQGLELKLLRTAPWERLLGPDARLILEWYDPRTSLPDQTDHLRKVREKKYGETILTTYALAAD